MEHAHRIGLRATAALHHVERAIHRAFSARLLAVVHQRIHEAGDHDVAELGVRQDLALDRAAAAGHRLIPPYFGRLAPYSERRWRRLAMPWVSSTPRRMW